MASKEHVHDVVVIGGGVAGLSAAKELMRHGCDNICVVEAQSRLGGRVKQVHGIAPWALDAGAELVHGQDSTIASFLVNDLKADLVKKEYPNYVYWRDGHDIVCACGDTGPGEDEIDSTFNLIEQLADLPTDDAPTDTTAEEWFRGRCSAAASKRVMPLLDALYANDLCSDLQSLGVAEAAWEARNWSDGEDTLVKGGSMAPLTAGLARGVPVRLGWPVRQVRWREQGKPWSGSGHGEAAAEVIGTNGEVLLARAVICAVPATQLQKQALQFTPAPGDPFQHILNATRVHNALKIWAVFRVPFWEAAAPLRRAMAAASENSGGQGPAELAVDDAASDAGSVDTDVSGPSTEAADHSMTSPGGESEPPRAPHCKPGRSLTESQQCGSTRTLGAESFSGRSSPGDSLSSGDSSSSDDEGARADTQAGARPGGVAEGATLGPEFWHMLCPESPVPEFWVPQHAPDGLEEATGATAVCASQGSAGGFGAAPLQADSVHVLQGFACATQADALSALGAPAAVQAFLEQLDQIFAGSDAKAASAAGADRAPGPASAAFVRGGIMDWAKEPYVEGGYSSPSPGIAAGARAALHALPGGTVFFAGEHTHERLNACLQGAMETGVRAAAQTLQSLGVCGEHLHDDKARNHACAS